MEALKDVNGNIVDVIHDGALLEDRYTHAKRPRITQVSVAPVGCSPPEVPKGCNGTTGSAPSTTPR